MTIGEWVGLVGGIVVGLTTIVSVIVKYFIKKQDLNNTYIATFAEIYKDQSIKHIEQNDKYLENSKDMIKVLEKNNNLIENNNLATTRLDETIKEFKEVTKIITDDIAMRALLESRKKG